MISQEQSLRRAMEIGNERDAEVDFNLPMSIFVTEYYRRNPQAYGHGIVNKIIFDTQGLLKSCPSEYGDAFSTSNNKKGTAELFYEGKSSFSSKKGTFRITHIRDFQDFDYFIICFVDRQDKFKEYYYILPKDYICKNPDVFKLGNMNNSKKENQNNVNVDKCVTIKKEVVFEKFGENNLLYGTDYKDLMSCIKSERLHGSMFVNPYKMSTPSKVRMFENPNTPIFKQTAVNTVLEKAIKKQVDFTNKAINELMKPKYSEKKYNRYTDQIGYYKGWVDGLKKTTKKTKTLTTYNDGYTEAKKWLKTL